MQSRGVTEMSVGAGEGVGGPRWSSARLAGGGGRKSGTQQRERE
jgi:hypothetical protein